MELSGSTAAAAINRGFDAVQSAATKIVSSERTGDPVDRQAQAALQLVEAEQQTQSATRALSAENEVIGTLLSTTA